MITGITTCERGHALNLTCSVLSFPPSRITWTLPGSNTNLHNETYILNNTGSATLIIHNVTVETSGRYICTAEHLDSTETVFSDVTVTCKWTGLTFLKRIVSILFY